MTRMQSGIGVVLVVAAAALAGAGSAQAATKWLCGPGVKDDPCRPSLSTALYRGWDERDQDGYAGARSRPWRRLLLRLSHGLQPDEAGSRRKRVDPELRSIALYQAARFSQACRVYAPVYRQATVPALQAGTTTRRDYLTAYGDVEDAFDAFLRRIGKRRAFVLVGHSQGTYHLQRLVRRRIDGHRALRRRMVSAVLLGGNVRVARGLRPRRCLSATCARASAPGQRSCVIAFSTFNETPPDPSLFGRGESRVASFLGLPKGRELESACTNPAALGSSRSVKLTSVVPTRAVRARHADRRGDLAARDPVAGRLDDVRAGRRRVTGRCSRAGGAHVLRIASAPGTPVPKASPSPDWGLHLVDANVAQADLVKVVRRQIRAYAR